MMKFTRTRLLVTLAGIAASVYIVDSTDFEAAAAAAAGGISVMVGAYNYGESKRPTLPQNNSYEA